MSHNTFVLVVKIRHGHFLSLAENRLHAQEDIRGPLSELQQQVLPEIQDQIQDYRYTHTLSQLSNINQIPDFFLFLLSLDLLT